VAGLDHRRDYCGRDSDVPDSQAEPKWGYAQISYCTDNAAVTAQAISVEDLYCLFDVRNLYNAFRYEFSGRSQRYLELSQQKEALPAGRYGGRASYCRSHPVDVEGL
jgi:hypothetical protein